jgi:N-acetylmuramic acid 6-phosphate (MurNAc-6-P) etherase
MSLMDALENPEGLKKKRAEQRREMWAAIKAESPDIAEFIEQVTKKFGKPAQVVYKCRGRVFDSSNLDSLTQKERKK